MIMLYSKHIIGIQSQHWKRNRLKKADKQLSFHTASQPRHNFILNTWDVLDTFSTVTNTLNGDKHDNAWGSTWNDTSLCSWRWIRRKSLPTDYYEYRLDITQGKSLESLDIALPVWQHVHSHDHIS